MGIDKQGRSGTLLCSYLLSLPQLPPPPQLERNYTEAEQRGPKQDGWVIIGAGDTITRASVSTEDLLPDASPRLGPQSTTSSTTTLSRPSPPPSVSLEVSPIVLPLDVGDEGDPQSAGQRDRADGKVDSVFKLHSSRRMKPTSSGRGVSIPSQRRWCRYIHLLFSNNAPSAYLSPGPQRVRLCSVTVLLHPLSGWQRPASLLAGKAWASVARYDDQYVSDLCQKGKDEAVPWGGVGGTGAFDTAKMFRSCGKMVELDTPVSSTIDEERVSLNW